MGNDDVKKNTLLYLEMDICARFLKCTHAEFEKLPYEEKSKWLIYCDTRAKKEQYAIDNPPK